MRPLRVVLFALGLAITSCGGPPPSNPRAGDPGETLSPTATPVFPCSSSEKSAWLVAYEDQDDLWLYDVRTDDLRRLTEDVGKRSEGRPEFLGNDCLLYSGSDLTASDPSASIELLSLAGEGRSRRIVDEQGLIRDFDVSPDGTSIVYLQIDHNDDGTYRLKEINLFGVFPRVLYTFSPNAGKGAGSEDEVVVAWSPDGQAILVTNTAGEAFNYGDRQESIFLLARDGRVLVPPWTGTHARWSPDGRTIYYRGYAGTNGIAWHAFDVASKKTKKLGMRSGTNNLAVSPDGARVAYDTSYFGDTPLGAAISKEVPVVYVYDLASGKETLLRENALGPLWISASQLLVTNAKEPGRSLNSWESLGTVTKLSTDGSRKKVSMKSTLWGAAVLFDE